MFEAINRFFYDLTKRNWAVGYHLYLSALLAGLIYALFIHWFGQHRLWTAILTFFIVMIIGYLNEVIDRDKERAEFWQDMGANAFGCLSMLGIAQAYFL